MYSTKRLGPEDFEERASASSASLCVRVPGRSHLRARICPVALLSADLLGFVAAAFLAFSVIEAARPQPLTRAFENVSALGAGWHGWGTFLVLVSLLCFLSARGHYTTRVPFWTQMQDVLLGSAVALAADAFITVAVYGLPVAAEAMLRWLLLVPCALIMRGAARSALNAAGLWTIETVVIATQRVLPQARSALVSEPRLGYRLAGSLDLEDAAAIGEDELAIRIVSQRGEFVVVGVSGAAPAAERAVIEGLRRARLPMAIVPAIEGIPVIGFRQHYFFGHDIVMLVSRNNLAQPFSRFVKAIFDQLLAALAVVLLAPLLAGLAAAIRMDGGPALYRHRRIGEGGRPFYCIKFRTMVPNAEEVLNRVLAADPEAAGEWTATQKLRNDPRITRVGQFLRKSSLDELPQLFNVLRGEMSLVGPRPIVHAEVARYAGEIDYYYETKPGITGLWQVSGRSDTSYERRVRLDVWYVRNWTLWHDIAILMKTIPAVFLRRGAI